jgi:glucose/arabinose dehydrogenase
MRHTQTAFFYFFSVLVSMNIFANIEMLKLDPGFKISIFASDLDSPRQMAEGINGTIFVGERGGQIVALSDSDRNGQVDSKRVIAESLTYSTGVSMFEGDLYFSEISKIWKIKNVESWLLKNHSGLPEKILVADDLPDEKWHGWKWLRHDLEGSLYTNVGAPCNICLSENPKYASILKLSEEKWEYVAKGVRNSVGFDFHPSTQKLFFTDNGRDWLGDDSPSCELNRVDEEGLFYGFPFQHAFNIKDPEFGDIDSGYDYVQPILELGAHVAPTGIAFYNNDFHFPEEFKNNLFITLHGSWNRSKKVGYKVLRVVLNEAGEVTTTEDFITGWLQGEKVVGRPSAPFVMSDGSLLISDDKMNVIYRITYTQ